jgi:hypothetical protein
MVQDVSDPDACEKCWAGKHKECTKVSPRNKAFMCGCEVCAEATEDEDCTCGKCPVHD